MKRNILFIVILFLNFITLGATYTSSLSGSWNSNSTWIGGVAPTLNGGSGQLSDDVIIEVGHTITLMGDLTIKNGASLTVKGTLIINNAGNVDFQLGSLVLVAAGGVLELNGLTNSNNSINVNIHGSLIVNGNYSAGSGSALSGSGDMSVSGTSSGSGTTFGVVLGCDNCSVASGGIIEDAIIDGNQTSQSAPIEPYYRYTYSQQIYYQSEINQDGNITQLSFEFNGYSSINFDVEIYMGHTTKTSFSSTTNWVSGLTKVYDGPYSVSNTAGWYSIVLNTPFYYNNTENLVIAVREKTYAYQSSYNEFYTGDGVVYRVLTFYDDGINPNPASPPTADYRSVWVPSLKLKIEPAGSPLPVELVSFIGVPLHEEIAVLLNWVTISEKNNDYFTIWKSIDGYNWDIINITHGSNTSQVILEYIYLDRDPFIGINYYNLSQTDFNGDTEFYGIIAVDFNQKNNKKYIINIYNLLGQPVDKNYKGPRLIIWNNGYVEKILN